MSWRAQMRRVRRVSSAATTATLRSTSIARSVMSPRLPMGVATMYRMPAPGPSTVVVSGTRRAWSAARVEVIDARGARPHLRDGRHLTLELGARDHPVDAFDHRSFEPLLDHLVDGLAPVHEAKQDPIDGRVREADLGLVRLARPQVRRW